MKKTEKKKKHIHIYTQEQKKKERKKKNRKTKPSIDRRNVRKVLCAGAMGPIWLGKQFN